ncbi:hypothetical protein TcCL_Unassigned03027 [Trypanosoma cruzi]|nr:hypothetical protein TcCL_Unassigned03027 [Trypanosoma cruzi]
MPTAVSLVATFAAEHSLNINADRSGPLCSASPHTDSLTRTLPTIVWAMGTHASSSTRCVCSAMRLIDTSILVCMSPLLRCGPCHAAISCGRVRRLERPGTPRDPFWLGASTVRCTTASRQSHRVRPSFTSTAWKCGTATAAQHRSAHAHQRRILLSTWPPIRHRCRGTLGSAHPLNTNASHFSDVLRTCVAQSDWSPFRRPCMKSGDIDPASEDAVVNGLRRVCNIIGTPHSHNRAPPIQHRNFPLGHCELQ